MKIEFKGIRQVLCSLSLLILVASCKPSGSGSSPAGHWEGNIVLPGLQLAIRVDLDQGANGWSGTIDIPAQAVRNFELSGLSVQADSVSFGMAGIPGNPKFEGKLGGRGNEISGNFTQMGQTHPFKLERKPKPPAQEIAETPSKGIPGKGLVGAWQGSLKPMQGVELRLLLEITKARDNALQGLLVSLDQGNSRVPMTTLTLETNAVYIELSSIGSTFEGDLSDDGSNISGDWQQLGRTTPITFVRLSHPPALQQ